MRKTARRTSSVTSSQSPSKRVLQLSRETVRVLTAAELPLAVSGCPTGTNPTTIQDGISDAC